MIRRILIYIIIAIGSIAAIFVLTEVILRLQRTQEKQSNRYQVEYINIMNERIRDFSTRVESNPLLPPFTAFHNSDIESEKRLQAVLDARLPTSTVLTGFDFLQGEANREATTYTAYINSFGFRGPERSEKKPRGTYRIIVLGTYQAFGYGVKDPETYAAVLERSLNRTLGPKIGKRFEVWNGGQPVATAIFALARAKHDLFSYEPDLVILDYGQVDTNTINANSLLLVFHLPDTRFVRWYIFGYGRKMLPLLEHSLVWEKLKRVYLEKARAAHTQEFVDTMRATVALADEKGVPVVLVRQLWAPPVEVYERIAGTSTPVLNLGPVFDTAPRDFPDPSEWHNTEWGKTWLNELNPKQVTGSGFFAAYHYKLNGYQLNARGQRLIAEALERLIAERYFSKSL